MKTIFTRTLMAALLTISISAFAESGNGKPDNAAAPSNVTQENTCSMGASAADSQDKQKTSEQQKVDQQDEEWLHDLQGTYGG